MSEEIMKSAEEQLAEVVKSTVAEVAEAKADKADVEAVKSAVDAIEVPSVEGFVKSEDVEAAMAAVREELAAEKAAREDLEATVKSAPAFIKKETLKMSNNFDWDTNDQINAKTELDLSGEFHKQFTGTTAVTGEPTMSQRVYHSMVQFNPWLALATTMPMNSSTAQLPQVTGITAAHEANVPTSINTATGHGGDIATRTLQTQNWTSRTYFSDSSLEDLVGLDPMVSSFMAQEISAAEATDATAQIKSAVNLASGNIARVDTAVATTRTPTSIDPYAEMIATLSSAYKMNGKFAMSRAAVENLRTITQGGTGSPLVIDPSTGEFKLFGYDIVVVDYLEDFGTNNNLVALFGDFNRGLIAGQRKSMSISRHEDTIPGGAYFYGNKRSRIQPWDYSALVGLRATTA